MVLKLFNDRVLKPKDASAAPTATNNAAPAAAPAGYLHHPFSPPLSALSNGSPVFVATTAASAANPALKPMSKSAGAIITNSLQGAPAAKTPRSIIIIVPSALTSLITIHNAVSFLTNGTFTNTQDVMPTKEKNNYVLLQRFDNHQV